MPEYRDARMTWSIGPGSRPTRRPWTRPGERRSSMGRSPARRSKICQHGLDCPRSWPRPKPPLSRTRLGSRHPRKWIRPFSGVCRRSLRRQGCPGGSLSRLRLASRCDCLHDEGRRPDPPGRDVQQSNPHGRVNAGRRSAGTTDVPGASQPGANSATNDEPIVYALLRWPGMRARRHDRAPLWQAPLGAPCPFPPQGVPGGGSTALVTNSGGRQNRAVSLRPGRSFLPVHPAARPACVHRGRVYGARLGLNRLSIGATWPLSDRA